MGQHQNTRKVGVWTLMHGLSLIQMGETFPLTSEHFKILFIHINYAHGFIMTLCFLSWNPPHYFCLSFPLLLSLSPSRLVLLLCPSRFLWPIRCYLLAPPMLEEGLFTRARFLLPISTTEDNISSSSSSLSSMAGYRPGQSYPHSPPGNTAAVGTRRQSSDLDGRQRSTSLRSFLQSCFLSLLSYSFVTFPSLGEGDIDLSFMVEHSAIPDS